MTDIIFASLLFPLLMSQKQNKTRLVSNIWHSFKQEVFKGVPNNGAKQVLFSLTEQTLRLASVHRQHKQEFQNAGSKTISVE